MSPHEAERLFTTEGGSRYLTSLIMQLHVFARALTAGLIEISEFEIQFPKDPTKDDPSYRDFCHAFPKQTPISRDAYERAAFHSRLKWAGRCWLQSLGEAEPRYEHQFNHGYGIADVMGPKLNVAVECGNTEPGKFFAAVESEREAVDRFVIFKFAWDSTGRDYSQVHAIELSASPEARIVLRADQSPQKVELREKFMVRRKRGRPPKRLTT